MAAHVGLDPAKDIDWVDGPKATRSSCSSTARSTHSSAFPPEPQELRARKIGHVVLNSATDRPWSQYFCCMLAGNADYRPQASGRDQARPARHPQGRRHLRHRAGEAAHVWSMAASRPLRLRAADADELPYGTWREYDPEDTLRFYALRLHEAGMIKSSPKEIIADGHRLAVPERAQARAEGVS